MDRNDHGPSAGSAQAAGSSVLGATDDEHAIIERIRRLESGGLRTFVAPDPLVIERAQGPWLITPDGRKLLDFAGSFAVTTTGHCHPAVVKAIRAQADVLIHCPSAYPSRLRAEFLEAIESITAPLFGAVAILPAMSGAMANEMAISLARYARPEGEIIAFSGGYFGRSVGTAPFAGKANYRQALGIGAQSHFAPFPYPLRHGGEATDFTMRYLESLTGPGGGAGPIAAVVIEPIQGNGGLVIPPDDFLPRLRAFCDRVGALLIVDEIQTGCGRTGKMWAVEHTGVVPDLMTIGKGIGGNMGVAAVVGKPDLMRWKADAYSSTFITNHIGLAAANAAIGVIRDERLPERSRELGDRWLPWLRQALAGVPHVAEIRGCGLWFALEFCDASGAPDAARTGRIAKDLRSRGVVMGGGGYAGNVLKMAPALVIDEADLRQGLQTVVDAVREG
jgi:4-aminobutyrate aminotransferase-like enzyme